MVGTLRVTMWPTYKRIAYVLKTIPLIVGDDICDGEKQRIEWVGQVGGRLEFHFLFTRQLGQSSNFV